ncbi:hypothetical protein MEG1DRAFT_03041 [Photorhabdus temperata subsp. temperata Meg1]|uniref:Uncharacterized protein n=1 Tax=Photorhabdus temperata subsp. temperata Meg1 TaxID=1393735 RepID=A0A081RUI7_PHOTE|nr:hypothetical protein MEG1DRAFT_03041 [Photorhabdus temperata subsp. temperata Meg1]
MFSKTALLTLVKEGVGHGITSLLRKNATYNGTTGIFMYRGNTTCNK